MPFATKMGLGSTGFMTKKGSHQRAARKRVHRRKVRDGFPVLHPFTSAEAAREYMGGEVIVCLRCGRALRSLAVHLRMIHSETAEDYHRFYKIPWRQKLTCADSKALKSAITKKRIDEGSFVIDPNAFELALDAIRKGRVRKRHFETPPALKRPDLNIAPIRDEEDFESIVRDIEAGIFYIPPIQRIPRSTWTGKYMRDATFRDRVNRARAKLPISVLSKAHRLHESEFLMKAIPNDVKVGMTAKQIGQKYLIGTMSAWRLVKRAQKKERKS